MNWELYCPNANEHARNGWSMLQHGRQDHAFSQNQMLWPIGQLDDDISEEASFQASTGITLSPEWQCSP